MLFVYSLSIFCVHHTLVRVLTWCERKVLDNETEVLWEGFTEEVCVFLTTISLLLLWDFLSEVFDMLLLFYAYCGAIFFLQRVRRVG